MKKNIIKTLTLLAVGVLMVSCNNQPSKMDGDKTSKRDLPTEGMLIAYVEMDSITNQYEYAKLLSDSLEKMAANATTKLNDMDKALERSYNSIQTRLQNNTFTSEQQYKNAVAAFEQERNTRVDLEARLNYDLMQKRDEFMKALKDSVDNFLKDYNKDKNFDIILRNSMSNEVILLAQPQYNITDDVVNGLNARYKK